MEQAPDLEGCAIQDPDHSVAFRAACSGDGPLRDGRVRVLHLVSTFEIKTDTKWLLQLCSRLDRERFACSVGCMYGGGDMRTRFDRAGIPTYDLAAPRGVDPAGLWRLWRLIRGLAPHVVHTHLLRADLYGGLAARLARVPVVLSSQYALFPYARVTSRACDGVLDRLCCALAGDALAVCEAIRQDLIGRLGWAPDRVHTVRTGLDFASWKPDRAARTSLRRAWGIPEDGAVVMTVARLSREKGIEVLVSAADQVRRACPNVRFVIVGDGPLRSGLVEQIGRQGLESVVRLAGFHADIPSVLSAADLFVLPSHSEGMPNAVLEAFAAGLPVVASAVGGLVEVIEHERTGLLVPAGDATALAGAISRLLADGALAYALAQAGAAAVRERFSVERVAREYEDLYEHLVTCRVEPVPATRKPTAEKHEGKTRRDAWVAGRSA